MIGQKIFQKNTSKVHSRVPFSRRKCFGSFAGLVGMVSTRFLRVVCRHDNVQKSDFHHDFLKNQYLQLYLKTGGSKLTFSPWTFTIQLRANVHCSTAFWGVQ